MSASRLLLVTAAFAVTSCSMMPPPVPITGAATQVSRLAGTWHGDYYSRETGRHGSIYFTLAAGKDTAFGEVLMVPRQPVQTTVKREGVVAAPHPEHHSLNISFVHAAGDSVYGYLDPYEDPDCQCTLMTWFMGRMTGDRIEGNYSSRNVETGELTSGYWNVSRKKSKEAAAAN
ncbi:MAG TPA: hypothetical protein VFQ05_06170 [Candidatus Eisenbacteria bacterium]|nr:hypothetical protein [Candidatus Eisenbacteria bacterium]